jgi:hypothetical protein
MWCDYCQRPVAGQKSTQKFAKLTATVLTGGGYAGLPGMYHCPFCGQRVRPMGTVVSSGVPSPPSLPSTDGGRLVMCSSCGSEHDSGGVVCSRCSFKENVLPTLSFQVRLAEDEGDIDGLRELAKRAEMYGPPGRALAGEIRTRNLETAAAGATSETLSGSTASAVTRWGALIPHTAALSARRKDRTSVDRDGTSVAMGLCTSRPVLAQRKRARGGGRQRAVGRTILSP